MVFKMRYTHHATSTNAPAEKISPEEESHWPQSQTVDGQREQGKNVIVRCNVCIGEVGKLEETLDEG